MKQPPLQKLIDSTIRLAIKEGVIKERNKSYIMSTLTSKTFWADAIERAVKTFAQVAGATIIASGVLGILDINAVQVLSVAGLGSLLSLLTSIGSAGTGKSDSASLVVETQPLK